MDRLTYLMQMDVEEEWGRETDTSHSCSQGDQTGRPDRDDVEC